MAKFVFQGVDYLRLTSNDHGPVEGWMDVAEHEYMAEDRAGRRAHYRWILNYYGRVGEHIFVGKNEEGAMVQVSGSLANDLFRPLSRQGGRCSRIDLQITSQPPNGPSDYLHDAFDIMATAPHLRGKPSLVQINDTNYGAKMVTVGSRQSQLYGRIYDKGKESKLEEWQGYVRHELEVKEEQARDLHFWLMEEITREHMIKAVVGNYFEKRGCPMYWQDFDTRETPVIEKRTKTDATKLAWLSTQVAPTVRDLIDHGRGVEALTALLQCIASDDTVEELLRQMILSLGR